MVSAQLSANNTLLKVCALLTVLYSTHLPEPMRKGVCVTNPREAYDDSLVRAQAYAHAPPATTALSLPFPATLTLFRKVTAFIRAQHACYAHRSRAVRVGACVHSTLDATATARAVVHYTLQAVYLHVFDVTEYRVAEWTIDIDRWPGDTSL